MILTQNTIFTKKECELIMTYNESHITNWEMSNRKYNSQPIKYSPKNSWLFDKLKHFVEINSNIEIINLKKIIHFHKFTKGDWFGRHNDVRDGRLYAVGVLLNNDFEGGEFKLYNPNEQILNKICGNTYVFDVTIDHEITPILDGERYSLLWFLQKEHINHKTNKLI